MPTAGDLGNIPIGQPNGASGLFGTLAPTVQGSVMNAGEAKPAHTLVVGEGTPPVPARLVRLIKSDQFVDFAELVPDNLELLRRLQASAVTGTNEAGHRRLRQVSSFGTWVQCFAITRPLCFGLLHLAHSFSWRTYNWSSMKRNAIPERDDCYTTHVSGSWLPTRRPSSGASCTPPCTQLPF